MTTEQRATPGGSPGAKWAAGLGGILAGLLIFVMMSIFMGGIDLGVVLALDQDSSLELGGAILFGALVLATVVGVPLGAFAGVKAMHAARAPSTALLTAVLGSAGSALALRGIPSAPSDPLLLPYFVFGTWFLAPLLSRLAVERSTDRTTRADE